MDEDTARLIRDAARRIDAEQPITHEMGLALLRYCECLELALVHVRNQNADLREQMVIDQMLKLPGKQYLQ